MEIIYGIPLIMTRYTAGMSWKLLFRTRPKDLNANLLLLQFFLKNTNLWTLYVYKYMFPSQARTAKTSLH